MNAARRIRFLSLAWGQHHVKGLCQFRKLLVSNVLHWLNGHRGTWQYRHPLELCPEVLLHRTEDSVQLLPVHVEARFGPDHEIGPGDLHIYGPLRAEALLDLARRPAAG